MTGKSKLIKRVMPKRTAYKEVTDDLGVTTLVEDKPKRRAPKKKAAPKKAPAKRKKQTKFKSTDPNDLTDIPDFLRRI